MWLQPNVLTRRPTVVEGLYSGLGSGAALTATQLDIKMKLLVEAPAAVEDALASLLDHHDVMLQVGQLFCCTERRDSRHRPVAVSREDHTHSWTRSDLDWE